MIRATKETEAGRRYLDLQRKAKQTGRPTDELIQLYGFLDRLALGACGPIRIARPHGRIQAVQCGHAIRWAEVSAQSSDDALRDARSTSVRQTPHTHALGSTTTHADRD